MKNSKILFSFFIMLLFIYVGRSQTPSNPIPYGWKRIYIKDAGFFDMPPTMEVQTGKYKEYVDHNKKIYGYETSDLTAQPIGLNDLQQEGVQKYSRIMFRTEYASQGDFQKLDFDFSELTASDINEINEMYKKQSIASLEGTTLKILEWYPLKFEKINGMSCIHIKFKRQLKDRPHVMVDMYYFQNNDRMHTFTLSYRISEEALWKSDLQTVLKSFRITEVR